MLTVVYNCFPSSSLQSYAVLNQCNYIVLDEADRMIDLGFEPQVWPCSFRSMHSDCRQEARSVNQQL